MADALATIPSFEDDPEPLTTRLPRVYEEDEEAPPTLRSPESGIVFQPREAHVHLVS